jgi:single-strand DNA-binding protein
MANLNKVMLIGRLTRDPELRSFSNGGRVANFGFAVNNRKKNQQTGEWEDVPVWLDCEAFNRGETGKLADHVERFLRKGSQAYLEGHLRLDEWDDKTTGQKRQKLKVVVEVMQLLDPRQDGGEGGGRPMSRSTPAPAARTNGAPRSSAPALADDFPAEDENPAGGGESDIPF